ncbi:MAG: hypothetical protein A2042_06565 [Candidatus Schekmanbacteria bacterium GWA2_38_11]|uniref:VWFA domain-containing protein n=1 Tax=Candidatus Schekmanbacteria bacterium GWA2_38_11 TaxID=1817876 RepID=A0A1F7RGI9_9BACT|nr:MAG: hypothetical protein A2042_06565 [Candidatus Schekmanbacteria bacterium GWA2_38_11]
MKRYQYSEWDGTQDKINLDEEKLFDQFTDYLLQDGDLNVALQWMMLQYLASNPDINLMSMDEYLNYLRSLKEEYFKTFNLDYSFDDIKKELKKILNKELQAIEMKFKDNQQELAERRFLLENIPKKLSKTIEALRYYDFQDKKAKQDFEKLLRDLEKLRQLEDFFEKYNRDFHGETPLPFKESVGMMEEFKRLENLEKDLQEGNFITINLEDLKYFLDNDIYKVFEYLQGIIEKFKNAGYIEVSGNRFSLTPKGIRRIGQNAIQSIYSSMKKDYFGTHETRLGGFGNVKLDHSKKYQYGDPLNINLSQTLMNSLKREYKTAPLALSSEDFEIYDVDYSSQSTTVMLIDMSFSMAWGNRFAGAKKVAVAFDHLIRTKFPKDNFYIVGFSSRARIISAEELPQLKLVDGSRDMENAFTNLQDGLRLAGRLISRHRSKNQQIITITDGQPTAYFYSGKLQFEWPMGYGGISPRACKETLKEVFRCTRQGITINTFMLDSTPALRSFVDQITKINKGRAFFTNPLDLGKYILVDYVEKKRKKVS